MRKIIGLALAVLLFISTEMMGQQITTIAGGLDFPGYETYAKKEHTTNLLYSIGLDGSGRVYHGIINILRINVISLKPDTIQALGPNDLLSSIAIDAAGNIFCSVGPNGHAIKRIDALTKSITTYAGTGVSGFSGDGGLATTAKVNNPVGLALDPSGNLYFFDGSFRIRRVDATTQIITTVAGTGAPGYNGDNIAATGASLGSSVDLACDADGNILIADENNFRIRKITLSSGLISTIAGTGVQGFSGDGGLATAANIDKPAAVQVDAMGNIFFMDGNNHRLRKIDASTQFVSTIAGIGLPAYGGTENGDGGQASIARISTTKIGSGQLRIAGDGSIYIFSNNRIRKINPNGVIRILHGGNAFYGDGVPATQALLSVPTGLCFNNGNILIADQGSSLVRAFDLNSQIITTLAGNGKGTSDGDGGQALSASMGIPFQVRPDSEGNLYVVDFGGGAVRKIDKLTSVITTVAGTLSVSGFSGDGGLATNAKLSFPSAITFDPQGNLLIADRANHRIRKVDKLTGIISTIAGNGTSGFSGDGGPATSASFNAISHLVHNANGDLYISDRFNHRIRMIDKNTGIITTVMGNGTTNYIQDGLHALATGLNWPYGISFDLQGNMAVADAANNRILFVNASDGKVRSLAGKSTAGFSGDGGPSKDAQLNFPRDLTFGPDGNLYILDTQNNRLRMIEEPSVITSLGEEYRHEEELPVVFPQPSSGTVFLRLPGADKNLPFESEVIDALGRSRIVNVLHAQGEFKIDLHGFSAGMYVVVIKQGFRTWNLKIINQ